MPTNTCRLGLAIILSFLAALADVNGTRAGEGISPSDDGIVRVRSVYPLAETIERLKNDIQTKGIMFFSAIDQARLAGDAGIRLPPSTLLTFGNPSLGIQFLTANPSAGLDWPVRLLVVQDEKGQVWAEYTDFAWIAHRHHITDRDAAFQMASKVIGSIASSVQAKGP